MTVHDRSLSPAFPSDPFLIDVRTTCQRLNISARTLWALTAADAIPVRKIGRSVRYSPAELAAWVALGCPTEPGSADRVRKAVKP